jgi:hypothetical protein
MMIGRGVRPLFVMMDWTDQADFLRLIRGL